MGSPEETLQGQVEEQDNPDRVLYGTFSGVFRPVFMTIVGVIMFVREAWIVGNAGLLGGWLIIVIGFAIVTLSAMSMSCITTNIRIGAGGAFSMISKSLGLEVGGSVGFPLYLAQAFAGAMYIFGFREGLVWAVNLLEKSGTLSFSLDFLSPLILDLVSFAIMFGIALISTTFAFNVQYLVLVFLIVGIVAFFLGPLESGFPEPVTWWGEFQGSPDNGFEGTNFWALFAIFFPAATGILAGANLSGDLKEPRKSIPRGTLWAIFVSFIIYMGVAYFSIRMAPIDELVSNYYVVIDYALWPPAVLAALLGATFSSGLACFVGAPRILQALADHEIIPFGHDSLAKVTSDGEPRNALLLTGVVVLGAILIRDLNLIAPMITMFFLITYMMLNFVVLVEQSLEMVSFRPTFAIPRWVPLLGTVGCLMTMIVISPVIGVTAVVIVLGLYFFLTRQQIAAKHGDMRSGLFVALAEWAAKRTYDLPSSKERAWKPNLMVPFSDPRDVRGVSDLLEQIARPNGSLYLVGCTEKHHHRQDAIVENLGRGFMQNGVFSRWTVVEGATFDAATISSLQTLAGEFLRPNILFLRLPDEAGEEAVQKIVRKAREYKIGVQLYMDDPRAQLGRRSTVNVWVRDQSPEWELNMDLGNLDLAMLTAFKLQKSWGADIRLVTAVPDEEHVERAESYLRNLLDLARFPDVEVQVHNTDFGEALESVPHADVELLGLPERPDYDFLRMMVDKRKSTCLFIADSGDENILA